MNNLKGNVQPLRNAQRWEGGKFILMAVGDECRSVIFVLPFHGGSAVYT